MNLNAQQILSELSINRGSRKCFIFDLDGTIIFENKYLSAEIEVLLKQIANAGHQLIFATGRPLKDFKMVMPHWAHDKPLTLFSGGVSMLNNEVIRSHGIHPQYVEEIVELCLARNYRFIMDGLFNYYHPDMEGMLLGILDTNSSIYRVKNLEQMLDHEIYKILLFDLHTMDLFSEYASSNSLLIKHHSYSDCFDIVSSLCNKHLGVLPFIGDYANQDVFVFGNDFNDLELLKHFDNGILFGDILELQQFSKLNLSYDENLGANFSRLIQTILEY